MTGVSAVVGNGCVSRGVVAHAINVAGESTRQAPCLSSYRVNVARLQTSNFKCTNSFFATIEFHIVV